MANLSCCTGHPLTWNADSTLATIVGDDGVPEGYTYDASGQRVTRSRHPLRRVPGGRYEEDTPSGTIRVSYQFNGQAIALRTIVGGTPTVQYTYGDRLGSVGAIITNGNLSAQQRSTPFGSIRQTNGLPTTRGFTGQRQDGTGLLFYNARYYDPAIGRFASADSIVPGAASGTGGAAASLGPSDKAALRPLTVDFHEPGFSAGLAQENRFTQEKGFALTERRGPAAGEGRVRRRGIPRRSTATATCSTTRCGIPIRVDTSSAYASFGMESPGSSTHSAGTSGRVCKVLQRGLRCSSLAGSSRTDWRPWYSMVLMGLTER